MIRSRSRKIMVVGGITPAPTNIWTPQGIVLDGGTDSDYQGAIQEPSVIYEGDAQILSGNVFKMWATMGWASRNMGYWESPDGVVWTPYASNPVVASKFRSWVFKVGSTYYMYSLGGSFDRLSSSDGISWSTDATNVMTVGAGGQWDDSSIDNICVWVEGSTWYMIYEGGDGGVFRLGLATSSDGLSWTKSPSNPILEFNSGSGSIGGPFVHKVGSRYILYCHVANTGTLPTDLAKYYSTDLINWTRSPAGLVYPRAERDEDFGGSNGQVADCHLVEVDGTTYLFYAASRNGAQALFNLKLATTPYTLPQLAMSDQGIISPFYPELCFNASFERAGAGGGDVIYDWTETPANGTIERTNTAGEYRSGTSKQWALKLTAGVPNDTVALAQYIPDTILTAGATYRYSGWVRGDGTNGGRLRIHDGSDKLPGGLPVQTTGTTFTYFEYDFVSSGATTLVACYCPTANGGYACFDDLSFKRIA